LAWVFTVSVTASSRASLDYLRALCTEQGVEDPETLAKQLLILIDGAITVALVMGDHRAADNAQCRVRKLLEL
jgi:hypothetical protein